MPSTNLLKKFRPAKRLEVIYKVDRGYRAYKGTHNGKNKIINFDDGDSLNYNNIKKNTGKKTFINIKNVSYNHVLVVNKDLYPVRILDDELLSTKEAAQILLKIQSNKINNNNEVRQAARTLSIMLKSKRAKSRFGSGSGSGSGSKSRSGSKSNGGGLKSKTKKRY